MSEDLLYSKTAEPELRAINFKDPFCDRMGDVDSGHMEVDPKL